MIVTDDQQVALGACIAARKTLAASAAADVALCWNAQEPQESTRMLLAQYSIHHHRGNQTPLPHLET